LLLVVAALVSLRVRAQEEVRVEVASLGALRFTFPDGVTADWFPSVQGAGWAHSTWRDGFLLEGSGQDAFTVGQRARIPVRNADNKVIDLFAQLETVEDAPEVLHFTYRFSAPEAVRLNTAYIECTLPTDQFAGAPVQTIDGPACPEALPIEPTEGQSHLSKGNASGLAAAEGTSHVIWVQLDQPRWCCVLDSRVWRVPVFNLQFCAIAAGEGTILGKDAGGEVSGNLVFACPVRVVEPPSAEPARSLADEKLHWDAHDPGMLVLANDQDEIIVNAGPDIPQGPEVPPWEIEVDPATQSSHCTAEWTGLGGAELSFEQAARTTDEGLVADVSLTAPDGYTHPPVRYGISLAADWFLGCTATFLCEHEPSVTLADEPLSPVLGRALARGVRISRGDTPLVEFEADSLRCWEVTADGRYFGLRQCLIGEPIWGHAYGSGGDHYEGKLTCRVLAGK